MAIVAAIPAALASAGPAGAAAADCQPFANKPCLLPFPSNLFTKRDKSSVTGLRVHAPQDTATNNDPHEDVRNTKAARTQKSDFLAPNGSEVDVCGGKPCHTDAYTP